MTNKRISESMLVRAMRQLARVLKIVDSDQELARIRDAKDEVVLRYQPIFAIENIPDLTDEVFQSFLLFRNNKHWSGLHRQQKYITEDMQLLKEGLKLLDFDVGDALMPTSEVSSELKETLRAELKALKKL